MQRVSDSPSSLHPCPHLEVVHSPLSTYIYSLKRLLRIAILSGTRELRIMEINSPKTTSYSGKITNVSGAITKEYATAGEEKKKSSFRMITLKQAGNIFKQCLVNNSFFTSRAQDFAVGNHVELTYEQRIKDTTEYVDAQGEVQKHGSTSEGITAVLVQEQGENVFSEATRQKMQFAAELGLTIKL